MCMSNPAFLELIISIYYPLVLILYSWHYQNSFKNLKVLSVLISSLEFLFPPPNLQSRSKETHQNCIFWLKFVHGYLGITPYCCSLITSEDVVSTFSSLTWPHIHNNMKPSIAIYSLVIEHHESLVNHTRSSRENSLISSNGSYLTSDDNKKNIPLYNSSHSLLKALKHNRTHATSTSLIIEHQEPLM